jgi:GNAT superfamily N-acetyltransferase
MKDSAIAAQTSVEIEQISAPVADIRALIEELEQELSANYPPEQRHGLALDAIFQPHIRFFIARINGSAVGCGGVAFFADFAELKRMYVRPESRGRGVADAIIARLAAEATSAGLRTLRLETGTQQSAAIRFYRRCGFEECVAFEPYASMPPHKIVSSVFMEKRLKAS